MNLPLLSISWFTAAFLLFHFTFKPVMPSNAEIPEKPSNLKSVLLQRLTGVLLFGLVPVIYLVWKADGLLWKVFNPIPVMEVVGYSLAGSVVIIMLNVFAGNHPENLKAYPQIRTRHWPVSLLILSALSWMAYLVAYEFMFRGWLFFSILREWGTLPAIILNLAFYALAHVPKGPREALGAIPLGAVLCVFCLKTGNIWPAVWVHFSLALSNEWIAIYYHPEMKVSRTWR